MADPLSTIAEEFAPAPTNYFDKGQAQTLISRYGNANRSAASSKRLADAAVQSHQLDRSMADEQRRADKEARDVLLQSREDIEYGERKSADETRSGFLKSFMENIDPKDPEYNSKLVGFMAELPSSIQKDQTFVDIVKIRSKQADEADTERRRVNELGIMQKNRKELVDTKAKHDKIFGNLTEEDRAEAPIDKDGNPDQLWMMRRATQREMENDLKVDKAKVDVRKEAAKELKNIDLMDDAKKAVFKETKDIVITNREAFPSKMSMLQKKYANKGTAAAPEDTVKMKDPEGYAAAKEWDKNMFEKEVDAAMDFDNPEDYINKVGGISDAARERRLRVWNYANQNKGKAPAETVTATETVTAKETVAPAAPQTTPAAPQTTPAAPKQEAAPTLRIVGDRIQITHPNGRVFYAPNTPENLKKVTGK